MNSYNILYTIMCCGYECPGVNIDSVFIKFVTSEIFFFPIQESIGSNFGKQCSRPHYSLENGIDSRFL